MGRGDDGMKCIEVRTLMKKGAIDDAMDVLETINTDKIQSIVDLKMIANVLERAGEYRRAKEIMQQSYDIKRTKMVVFRLSYLSVKTNEFNDAEAYYQEFTQMAPNSPDRYILRYGIDKAKNADFVLRIASLKKLKQLEYTEEWGYELAKIYHKAGLDDDCIRECHDLMIYFGEGVIVDKARLLCKYHQEGRQSLDEYGLFEENLTPEEVEENRNRYFSETADFSKDIPEIEARYDLHNQEVSPVWEEIPEPELTTDIQVEYQDNKAAEEAEAVLAASIADVMDPDVFHGSEMRELYADPTLDDLYEQVDVRDGLEEVEVESIVAEHMEVSAEELIEELVDSIEEEPEDGNAMLEAIEIQEEIVASEDTPGCVEEVAEEVQEEVQKPGKHSRRNARRAAKRKKRQEEAEKAAAKADKEEVIESSMEEVLDQAVQEKMIAEASVQEESLAEAHAEEDLLAKAVEEVLEEKMVEAEKEIKEAEAVESEPIESSLENASNEKLEDTKSCEESYESNFYDTYGMLLWGYFQKYQEDTRLCEDVYSALERCMDGKRPMNFVLTCKSKERYIELGKDLAKAMQSLGLTKKQQLARIEAEKLNRIHLEQKYEEIKGGCLLVEDAKKITADTAQSIMNMINEIPDNIVVILCDARVYMKDLMDEYSIMKKYFPFDISMK